MLKRLKKYSATIDHFLASYHGGKPESGNEQLYQHFQNFKLSDAWFGSADAVSALQTLNNCIQSVMPAYLNQKRLALSNIVLVIESGAPFEGFETAFLLALLGAEVQVVVPDRCRKSFVLLSELATECGALNKSITICNGIPGKSDAIISINALHSLTALEYFGKRNFLKITQQGVSATLTGFETDVEMEDLAKNICSYSCKSWFSVKHLEVPVDFDFGRLFRTIESYSSMRLNHRYFNHYEYFKSVFLINNIPHQDNGFLLFTPDKNFNGKISVVTWDSNDLTDEVMNISAEGDVNNQVESFNLRLHKFYQLIFNQVVDFVSGREAYSQT